MNAADLPDEALFEAALNCPTPADRAALLDQACAGQPELRRRLEVLLAAHEQSGAFLETPAAARDPALKLDLVAEEGPGTVIGRYKLLEKIGEGGAGVVYMAEQTEPIRRKVALKVIKLGMDTRQVVARFEVERQALALMDHPNIARVLDAGATDTGRPYFVMELVRGFKITSYCDQNNLSTGQRLDLFMQVCHAVQHAHQKGIIHRDLKPSNILVTLHDGVPVPTVIDFGIAKATERPLTDKTLYTAYQQFIGTPAYMSPEQAEMSGLDIDTRSDIYSLGVLLYELLTGRTPFEQKELLQAGVDEMRRWIREREPPRPSTRLSTLTQAELTDVARHHGAEAPNLIPLVRGDLDWIVVKCLEKDRRRRYETANSVAVDIEHYLKHEPVSAAAPSRLYRARKFVRRHKLGLAMAAGMVMLLVAGVMVSLWQAVRATRAERAQKLLRQEAEAGRQEARTEAAKSQQVAEFLKDMLAGVDPGVAQGRDTTLLREILDKTAARVVKDLTNQPEVEAELLLTLGSTYMELGEFDRAVALAREGVRLRTAPGETNALAADSLYVLARVLARRGSRPADLVEAEALLRQTLPLQRKLRGDEDKSVADTMALLAGTLRLAGKLAEAEDLYNEVLKLLRGLFGHQDLSVASALNGFALVLGDQGKLSEAEAALREALAIVEKLPEPQRLELARSRLNLAIVLKRQGNLAEAEPNYWAALKMRRELSGVTNVYTAATVKALAYCLRQQDKKAELEGLYREELNLRIEAFGNKHLEVGRALVALADELQRQDKLAEAEDAYRQALEIVGEQPESDSRQVGEALSGLVAVLEKQGKLLEAEQLCRQWVGVQRKLGKEDWVLAGSLDAFAKVLQAEDKFSEAVVVRREHVALVKTLARGDFNPVADALFSLAELLGDQGDLAGAKAAGLKALPLYLQELQRAPTNNWVNRSYGATLYGCALTCVGTGDTNGYRAIAAQIVAHLENALPWQKLLLSGACALAPDAVTNYAPLLATVTNALAGRTNSPKPVFGLQTLGALLYRAGRYPEAVRQLTEPYRPGQPGDTNARTITPAWGAYFLALAHGRLSHTNEAFECFQRASSLDPFAGGTRGPAAAAVPWLGRLTLQLLRAEADSVLNARTSPPTSSSRKDE